MTNTPAGSVDLEALRRSGYTDCSACGTSKHLAPHTWELLADELASLRAERDLLQLRIERKEPEEVTLAKGELAKLLHQGMRAELAAARAALEHMRHLRWENCEECTALLQHYDTTRGGHE